MNHAACLLIPLAVVMASSMAQVPAADRAELSLAIRQGNFERVTAIVEKSPALVRAADESGFTPLHIAATAGRVDIIEFLLQRGADIEARTAGGQTPLFQTVPLASAEAFDCLLRKGAVLGARDNSGRSILQFALFWQRPAMANLILARGFAIEAEGPAAEEMLGEAANAGLATVVDTLLSRNVPMSIALRNGTTLLHSAARGGLVEFAQRVIKAGAAIDARDQHGLTPLHVAAFHGRDDMVALLLANGADLSRRGYDGRSALHLADYAGRATTVALLTRAGARATPVSYPELSGPYLGQPVPGPEPRLFAPGIVSSEEHETNITFTPDGRELCLSRINADQSRRWLAVMRVERGRWLAPQPLPFGAGGADFEGAYSADGRRLFFSSDRSLQAGGPRKRDMDLWVVEREGDSWGEPRNLGPAVNGQSSEYMPSVDREGNLYFERNGLNVARWRNGAYLQAEKIGPGITNVLNLGHPFVAPDGSYILYDARRPGSARSLLFISYRLKTGDWSPGVRAFDQDDAREYESCPTVSPDGRFVFFGRDHDIYWASAAFIEKRRPRE
jgi:ankyrin repeat protein